MFYFYVLKSQKDNGLYYGSTSDLRRRVKEHNSGYVSSTKSRVPFRLIYYEAYFEESLARTREMTVKRSGTSRDSLTKRIGV